MKDGQDRPPPAEPTGHDCTQRADTLPFGIEESPAFRPSPPPSALLSAHNLPVPPVPPLRRNREAESGGAGGIISDPAEAHAQHDRPFAPNTLYGPNTCTTAATFNAGNEFRLRAFRRPGS